MFGSGYIELLAREMTADLHSIRDVAASEALSSGVRVSADLVSKGISFGSIVALPNGNFDVSSQFRVTLFRMNIKRHILDSTSFKKLHVECMK